MKLVIQIPAFNEEELLPKALAVLDHNVPGFDEVEWLAGEGITGGYPDGTFRPASVVSRGSMATFLHRAA